MGFVSSFIDLSQGMLFVESPRCKERLQIKLQLDVCDGVIEDIKLHGERYTMLCMLYMYVYILLKFKIEREFERQVDN